MKGFPKIHGQYPNNWLDAGANLIARNLEIP